MAEVSIQNPLADLGCELVGVEAGQMAHELEVAVTPGATKTA